MQIFWGCRKCMSKESSASTYFASNALHQSNVWAHQILSKIFTMINWPRALAICSLQTYMIFFYLWGQTLDVFSSSGIFSSFFFGTCFIHCCLEKTFGLTFLPRKDIQCILMDVIYGMIWDHFWIFWFTPFQVNWGQRRPRG